MRWQAYPLLKEYMPKGNGVVSVKYGAVVFHSVGFVWGLGVRELEKEVCGVVTCSY